MCPIYTGIGDKGRTQLGTGEDIAKNDARLECYGTIDELTSHLGLLRDHIAASSVPEVAALASEVLLAQRDLFALASELAFPARGTESARYRIISPAHAERIERSIDRMTATMPPLRHFLIPGGQQTASHAHVARTVCRRLERVMVSLHAAEPVRGECLVYVNRLSDWLFTLARAIQVKSGAPETRA